MLMVVNHIMSSVQLLIMCVTPVYIRYMKTQIKVYFIFIRRCIPDNNAEILVKVIHKNFMGGEDFLGQLCLDLRDFDVYSKPKAG